jgi:hypothetical protein
MSVRTGRKPASEYYERSRMEGDDYTTRDLQVIQSALREGLNKSGWDQERGVRRAEYRKVLDKTMKKLYQSDNCQL